MTFVSDYLMNKVVIEDVDSYVDAWHNGEAGDITLRRYLGLTKHEYSLFLQDADALYKILNDRKSNE